MTRRLRPILGGTFDPVHNGHLRLALEIAEWCGEPVTLLPSGRPAHRGAPGATPAMRRRMLELAAQGFPQLAVDDRELVRPGATYTVDTLEALHAEAGEGPAPAIALVLGADAFAGLERWHRWKRVCELAHFIVVPRPGQEPTPGARLAAWLRGRRARTPEALQAAPASAVAWVRVTPLEISATALRTLLAAGRDPAFLVPEPVREFLLRERPYAAAAGDGAGPSV